jgi:hypothetical protein
MISFGLFAQNTTGKEDFIRPYSGIMAPFFTFELIQSRGMWLIVCHSAPAELANFFNQELPPIPLRCVTPFA